jgi:hypothetical protein
MPFRKAKPLETAKIYELIYWMGCSVRFRSSGFSRHRGEIQTVNGFLEVFRQARLWDSPNKQIAEIYVQRTQATGKAWIKGGTGKVSEEAIILINKKLSSLSLGPRERLSGSGKATSIRHGKSSLKLRDEVPNANAAVDCAVKKVWVLEPPENFVDYDLLDPKYQNPRGPSTAYRLHANDKV